MQCHFKQVISLLFPNEHLKIEAKFFQLSIFADNGLENLLNVYVIRAILL